ncbi:hypothetical protein ACH4F6_39080 [Streptomyces sp. NPDC017936]|uniref:hypothetical protein n=1 Tax=Streptomyces sp. NPDC017936 TaxID=3365016 RepID=UPI0037BD7AD9
MAGRELKDGQEVLLRGSGGAPFRVTVGQPFTRDLIERRIKAGEWSWPDDEPEAAAQAGPEPRTEKKSKPSDRPGDDGPQPRTEFASDPGDREGEAGPQPRTEIVSEPGTRSDVAPEETGTDPDRPAANAPKAEWVVYVARTQHMSREDAANYTKADLIEMAK